ncbi:MAG: methionine--tRNA ligase [Methylocystaceae bacterium]
MDNGLKEAKNTMDGRPSFYITTPIYYPSDNLHIGHAYTTVAADCIARFKRMQGYDVHYLTGTDEHGQKIERVAREKGLTPQEHVDRIVAGIKVLWEKLLISYDDFIRTTEPRHEKVVQDLMQKIYEKGDIYKAEYEGWYCTPCETFFTERQLAEGKCPDCGRDVELLKEESYFFRMSKYAPQLLEHIAAHPEFIEPESRRNEMISFIKSGLEDLCISRTTFSWGIPVPFNDRHVTYVWFDALTNYISAIGYGIDNEQFNRYWPADVHLMAKDIVRFHTIIWPAMLLAAEIPLPKRVFAHGWILLEGGKMSKSKGNVIDPLVLVDKYGVDAIRYYLLSDMRYGQDGLYSEEILVNRINSDLANDLGNLASRTVAMLERYFAGQIPSPTAPADLDDQLREAARKAYHETTRQLDRMDLAAAMAAVMELVRRANKYIDETAPWVLAKDDAQRERLGTVLYNLVEALRVAIVLLAPAMPTLPGRVNQQYNLFADPDNLDWEEADTWGITQPGTMVKKREALFPRVDIKEALNLEKAEPVAAKTVCAPAAAPEESKKEGEVKMEAVGEGFAEITIDQFAQTELRVALVKNCEKHPNADKLLVLTLDLGSEERTVVSGIAKWYQPEALIGKKVILVANLKPAKMRGILSQGMILAAHDADDNLEVVSIDGPIALGAQVR